MIRMAGTTLSSSWVLRTAARYSVLAARRDQNFSTASLPARCEGADDGAAVSGVLPAPNQPLGHESIYHAGGGRHLDAKLPGDAGHAAGPVGKVEERLGLRHGKVDASPR